MQKYVCLETAKKLKEAGFEVKTEKFYSLAGMLNNGVSCQETTLMKYTAPDIPELLEVLPFSIKKANILPCYLNFGKRQQGYFIEYYNAIENGVWLKKIENKELVEALAEMAIWLNKRGV
ncbi:MAG: hypothetical protein V1709_00960 [Planctomycetota bacterium]